MTFVIYNQFFLLSPPQFSSVIPNIIIDIRLPGVRRAEFHGKKKV